MPNHNVFDGFSNPVYTQMTNTYQSPGIVAPPESSASVAGRLFSVTASASATVVLTLISATITLMISNPAASGKTLYVSRITGSIGGSSLLSSLAGSASVLKGGSLSSPSSLTPANNNFSSAQASAMTARSSTSAVSGGTTLLSFQLAPGPFSQEYAGRLIVPPGSAIALTVTSSSSTIGLTMTSAANISWWEA